MHEKKAALFRARPSNRVPNGSAATARELSDDVRHMQSGNVRSYAGWVAVGTMAVIAYMVWVGTR